MKTTDSGSVRRAMWALALAGVMVALTGCNDDDADAGPTPGIQTAASVSGAVCTLTDGSGKALAASVTTSPSGSATFTGIAGASGLALVACSGGSDTDLACGRTLTAVKLLG